MSIVEKAIESTPQASTPVPRQPQRRSEQGGDNSDRPLVLLRHLAESNMLLSREDSPRAAEQIRRLKRPLLTNAYGDLAQKDGNLVMMASPTPGAGKSFLTIQLARALCVDRERSVVIVDADNTKATITRGLELGDRRGLFDLLNETGRAPLESLSLQTDLPGLSVIPTGGRYEDSEELLATGRARDAFGELASRDRSRIVLVDCPPLLATPDALTLAAIAGQILVVVGAGSTDRDSIKRTMEILSSVDRPVGLVLNQAPLSSWLPDYQRYGYGDY